ncbi:MAG: hypothetical protein AMJ53_03950 [Gammaproteobacteria bacterium SG8_11]|nr:MAG: hypothetical protein AMJ53_03950 [Gammaproteobacteria bacterium SG8_11]
MFKDTAEEFRYEEKGSLLVRVGMAFFGIIFLFFPFLMLSIMGGISLFTSGKFGLVILFFICVLFAIIFCGFCFKVAFFVPRQTIIFKKGKKIIYYLTNRPFKKQSKEIYQFSDVNNLEVIQSDSSMDFPSYWISLSINSGRTFTIGHFDERSEAEERAGQIDQIINFL